ncbi:hypothetical protein BU17DRAFT_68492 [Hysterangium stoloniferum]|nr:hypothetical protein BU17DRAFT_68492 [Hysterangium stoloniferum]
MSEHPRDCDSGRQRTQFDSHGQRSRRSPSVPSALYSPPASSAFASAPRPTLPPLNTSSPSRAMSSSSSHHASGFRAQSPTGRYQESEIPSSGYHSPSNTAANQTSLWTESRGLSFPSAPTNWPSHLAGFDMRYPQASNTSSSYYTSANSSTQPFSQDTQRGRLPPLTTAGLDPHQSTSYLPQGQSSRSTMPYFSTTSRGAPYSLQQQQHYQPSSHHHHARPAGYSNSVAVPPPPFGVGEWGSSPSLSPEQSRHDPPYSTSAYGYSQEREAWGPAELPSPSSDRAPDEPMVKKKRKRADANQLRVLNATYQRTAFPSTQERESLAKELDMSPRSVQIWFQNKRQSMRQSRNQTNNLPPILHHAYSTNTGEPRPTHQSYQVLSAEASSSRRRDDSPPDERRGRSG